MKTIWKRQRQNAQISVFKVYKELQKYEPSLTEELYREIESGVREMPKHLIGPFGKYVNKKRDDYKLEKTFGKMEVEQWYRDTNIKELIKEYGYTQKEVGEKLGVKQGHMCNVINKKGAVSVEIKEKLRDFLTNDLNKKIPPVPGSVKPKRKYVRKEKPVKVSEVVKTETVEVSKEDLNLIIDKLDKVLELGNLLDNACKVIEEKQKKIDKLEQIVEIYEKVIK